MKIKDIEYSRPAYEDIEEIFRAQTVKLKAAKSAAEQKAAYIETDKLLEHINTMGTISNIRFTLDMTDAFYAEEKEYWDEITPKTDNLLLKLTDELLNSAYRGELEKIMPKIIFTNAEIFKKSMSEIIVADLQEENNLTTEYQKLMSGLTVNFRGTDYTPSRLRIFMDGADRTAREAAYNAYGAVLETHKEELDGIFDRLVRVRDRMAKKMGYGNFIELGYYRMGRNCYDVSDVAKFRESVKKHIVPAVVKLKKGVAKKLGIKGIKLYDNEVYLADGLPKPVLDAVGIMKEGGRMYDELDGELGSLYRTLTESGAFDVESRPGKWGGGYCTYINEYRLPFILSNFNGTSMDVDVLTHEFGHAYQAYCGGALEYEAVREPGMETCEVHSMSMELLTYGYMERFFGAAADDYRYAHLAGSLSCSPYGVIVDYFQHLVYAKPEMTASERNDTWARLEAEFRPYMDAEGLAFFGEGRAWQIKQHIYEQPFYYIDYCLAQTVALQFKRLADKDFAGAFARYKRFVGYCGQETFTDILRLTGLETPFDERVIEEIAGIVRARE